MSNNVYMSAVAYDNVRRTVFDINLMLDRKFSLDREDTIMLKEFIRLLTDQIAEFQYV